MILIPARCDEKINAVRCVRFLIRKRKFDGAVSILVPGGLIGCLLQGEVLKTMACHGI